MRIHGLLIAVRSTAGSVWRALTPVQRKWTGAVVALSLFVLSQGFLTTIGIGLLLSLPVFVWHRREMNGSSLDIGHGTGEGLGTLVIATSACFLFGGFPHGF